MLKLAPLESPQAAKNGAESPTHDAPASLSTDVALPRRPGDCAKFMDTLCTAQPPRVTPTLSPLSSSQVASLRQHPKSERRANPKRGAEGFAGARRSA